MSNDYDVICKQLQTASATLSDTVDKLERAVRGVHEYTVDNFLECRQLIVQAVETEYPDFLNDESFIEKLNDLNTRAAHVQGPVDEAGQLVMRIKRSVHKVVPVLDKAADVKANGDGDADAGLKELDKAVKVLLQSKLLDNCIELRDSKVVNMQKICYRFADMYTFYMIDMMQRTNTADSIPGGDTWRMFIRFQNRLQSTIIDQKLDPGVKHANYLCSKASGFANDMCNAMSALLQQPVNDNETILDRQTRSTARAIDSEASTDTVLRDAASVLENDYLAIKVQGLCGANMVNTLKYMCHLRAALHSHGGWRDGIFEGERLRYDMWRQLNKLIGDESLEARPVSVAHSMISNELGRAVETAVNECKGTADVIDHSNRFNIAQQRNIINDTLAVINDVKLQTVCKTVIDMIDDGVATWASDAMQGLNQLLSYDTKDSDVANNLVIEPAENAVKYLAAAVSDDLPALKDSLLALSDDIDKLSSALNVKLEKLNTM